MQSSGSPKGDAALAFASLSVYANNTKNNAAVEDARNALFEEMRKVKTIGV